MGIRSLVRLAHCLTPRPLRVHDSKKSLPTPAASGPLTVTKATARPVLSPDGTEARSEFFAGHSWIGADASENHGTFMVHALDCGPDSGVLSSLLTFDDAGALNGGPGIFVACLDGEAIYQPVFIDWLEGTIPIAKRVTSGDLVRMSAERADGVATYTMENLTRGWEESFEGSGDYANAFVDVGDGAIEITGPPAVPLDPPVFGRDPVKDVVLNSVDLSDSGSIKVQRVDEDDPDNVLERATKYRDILPDQRFSLINKT